MPSCRPPSSPKPLQAEQGLATRKIPWAIPVRRPRAAPRPRPSLATALPACGPGRQSVTSAAAAPASSSAGAHTVQARQSGRRRLRGTTPGRLAAQSFGFAGLTSRLPQLLLQHHRPCSVRYETRPPLPGSLRLGPKGLLRTVPLKAWTCEPAGRGASRRLQIQNRSATDPSWYKQERNPRRPVRLQRQQSSWLRRYGSGQTCLRRP
mmetsp:Transcript_14181/g.45823  ORF Transcript_14181/g.45823 Transcript_14181/m.45823 type:complete len:207 (-) Transcript_14181:82-702(-)